MKPSYLTSEFVALWGIPAITSGIGMSMHSPLVVACSVLGAGAMGCCFIVMRQKSKAGAA